MTSNALHPASRQAAHLAHADLRLYIHVPFCEHKCHYCDFNSHVRRQINWQNWLQGILRDWQSHHIPPKHIDSIFIGGGTPSLMPVDILEALLQAIQNRCQLVPQAEITMEANPGSADAGRFAAYRQCGINRLSIGVQSLQSDELRWLERIHDPQQALQAFTMARDAGFDNINLDLMYGLPAQPLHRWLQSLHQACELQPEHLSCYQLTVEPGTRLASMHASNPDMQWPDDDQAAGFFQQTRHVLAEHGFAAYEISNYARNNRYCQHNDGYWLYDDYIGLGPGAAGKYDLADGGVIRWWNIRSPETYARQIASGGHGVAGEERMNKEEAAREAFWLGLRRNHGISHPRFCQRFSPALLQRQQQACRQWQQQGMLAIQQQQTCITPQGWLMADSIAASVF